MHPNAAAQLRALAQTSRGLILYEQPKSLYWSPSFSLQMDNLCIDQGKGDRRQPLTTWEPR